MKDFSEMNRVNAFSAGCGSVFDIGLLEDDAFYQGDSSANLYADWVNVGGYISSQISAYDKTNKAR